MQPDWINLEGLANLRDVGGIPTTDGGKIEARRLLRSDNLQDLTAADIQLLLDFGLTDVIDLRSDFEVESEGPGPLTKQQAIRIHHHSLFREWRPGVGEDKDIDRPEVLPDEALPWVDVQPTVQVDNSVASIYLSYLVDRPDSIVSALRTIGESEGATLVHCAAGKDRTGTVVALALSLAGAEPDAIVADYVASSERMQAILDRLLATTTYHDNVKDRPISAHLTHAETMQAVLHHVDRDYGGVPALLARFDWTERDTDRLRAKLRT